MDLGARNYDPALGRFMNLDPLAEQYTFQSTYALAINNPILFGDINGEGVKTDYKLDKKTGVTTRVDENDGSENNKNDRLFSTDDDGNVNKDDFVQIDKKEAKDETVISQLSENKTNKFTGQKISWGLTGSIEKVFKVFKFAAENSNVEWGLQGIKGNDGSHNYFLGTRHKEGRALSFHDPGTFGVGKDLSVSQTLFKLHSHPRTLGGSRTDMKLINTYVEDGLSPSMDLFYIYHTKTKTLVKYNNVKSNIFSKKINTSSDFYTGKYK